LRAGVDVHFPAYVARRVGGAARLCTLSSAGYHPLEIDSNGERIVFQAYDYLPATAANLHDLR
jgi:hypothetical protein